MQLFFPVWRKKTESRKTKNFKVLLNITRANQIDTMFCIMLIESMITTGFSVGKKSGNAVVRNKIKRQVRMMLQELCDFNSGYDYILIIRKNYDISQYQQNKKELSLLYNSVYNKQGQTFTKEN